MSLRTQLTLWVAVLFLSLQGLTSLVVWLYQRAAFNDLLDNRIVTRANIVINEYKMNSPEFNVHELLRYFGHDYAKNVAAAGTRVNVMTPRGPLAPIDEVLWPSVLSSVGETAVKSKSIAKATFDKDWFTTPDTNPAGTRSIAVPVTLSNGETWAVQVAMSTAFVHAQIGMVSKLFFIASLAGLITTGLSGWYISKLAVQPLQQITALANQLRPESIAKHFSADDSTAEVKTLTLALDAARERIRLAFSAQERFLSNISHELKTPIATLLVEAQTIERSELSKPAAAFVRTTEEEMRRLGKLIESFLTLTRIRDGKGLTRLSPVPVNELVLDCVAHCSPMARQYTVRLRPSLVEEDEYLDASISGEPELLRTMLDNLVRNAIRFSPQNGSVYISAAIKENRVILSVADEGPGLPPHLLKNAFDRFVQADEEMRKGRGHGLGLTIAQAVAELHNGKITVSNREGSGAEFVADIPLMGAAIPQHDENNNAPSEQVTA